jgi:amidase
MPIPPPDAADVRALAEELGLPLAAAELEAWARLAGAFLGAFDWIDAQPEPPRPAPPARSHRAPRAEENPFGAWVVRTSVVERKSGRLAGRTLALKDNVALAGVPMSGGTSFLAGFVPGEDATVARRCLDEGAEITGKAACEYLSGSAGSHTSATGPVRNPHRPTHTAGGSSSGCGALVAAGAVDLAIGGDQGGSIRFPASFCGIVGMKPTYGLVPYTGILSIDVHIDHTGPMTATVADNALLLEVIAGPDGVDPRQRNARADAYTEALGRGVRGLRIGLLQEGFALAESEPAIETAVRAAAERLAGQGAKVEPVSVPSHTRNGVLVVPFIVTGGMDVLRRGGFALQAGSGVLAGLPEAFEALRDHMGELPPNLVQQLLASVHAERHGAARVYAKALRLRELARAAYDDVLSEVDALLMPTTTCTAPPLPGPRANLRERIAACTRGFGNTGQFDVTGHPAISVPCGKADGLPIGCMLVGRHFEEKTLYRIAEAIEQTS